MPTLGEFNKLRGLTSADRSETDQKAINDIMGYKEEPEPVQVDSTRLPARG